MEAIVGITLTEIVKWFFVVGMVMYCGFAAVVVLQVRVMTETIEAEANLVVKAAALVHLMMAILLAALAIILL